MMLGSWEGVTGGRDKPNLLPTGEDSRVWLPAISMAVHLKHHLVSPPTYICIIYWTPRKCTNHTGPCQAEDSTLDLSGSESGPPDVYTCGSDSVSEGPEGRAAPSASPQSQEALPHLNESGCWFSAPQEWRQPVRQANHRVQRQRGTFPLHCLFSGKLTLGRRELTPSSGWVVLEIARRELGKLPRF